MNNIASLKTLRNVLFYAVMLVVSLLSRANADTALENVEPVNGSNTQATISSEQIVGSSEQIVDKKNQQLPKGLIFKDNQPASSAPSPGMTSVGQIALGLMLIIGLILLMAWCAKRLNLNKFGGVSPIEMMGSLSVGPKEKIMMVNVDGVRLVLGVTSQTINTLHVLPDKNLSEVNAPELSQKEIRLAPKFSDTMKDVMKASMTGKVKASVASE